MTVPAGVSRRVAYTATGATTGPFSVPFPFFEIAVYLDGEIVSSLDYTISQSSPGATGSVTFDSAPTGSVVIIGDTTVEQEIDFISVDAVEPETAERALDRGTMIDQEQERKLGLVLTLPPYAEPLDPIDLGDQAGVPVVVRDDGGIEDFDNAGEAGYLRVDADGVMQVVVETIEDGTPIVRLSVDPATGSPYAVDTHVELSRPTASEQISESWPTDTLFLKLSEVGLINGEIGPAQPVDTTVLWLDTAAGTTVPATWKYHNGSAWVAASGAQVAVHVLVRGGFDATDFAAASHAHAASDITSGTIATARLGSGTADGTKVLYGDSTWGDVPETGVLDIRLGAVGNTAYNLTSTTGGDYDAPVSGHVVTGLETQGAGLIEEMRYRAVQYDLGAGFFIISEL